VWHARAAGVSLSLIRKEVYDAAKWFLVTTLDGGVFRPPGFPGGQS
jgi:hypothetical protein